nr:putative ribonuclease H-like domain-containing protein [Tanacetum cinerariifolium]
MWEAIKSRFGGNDESKKMQKYLLKQQFKGFSMSTSEGLHKRYDRFQTLLSQSEIHGAGVSHKDANQKFLRSLPSSWCQVALIMRTKPGLDTLSFDDLYNNLRVFERDVKGTTASSSNKQNVALMIDYRAKGNQDSRRRDIRHNGNKTRDNGRRPAYQDDSRHVEEDAQNYAMMAYSSSNSGSENETSPDESDSKPNGYASCKSDSSVETSTSIPEPVENASKVVCKPKVWTDAPIIEEYESNSDNDLVCNVQEDKENPSFAFTYFDKHVKTYRENIKETGTTNHSPKIKKQDRNGHTGKSLGYAFTRKACFVCGSFSHLIRDYDFHKKRMAKQAELPKDDLHRALNDKRNVNSGCSRHMTGNKAHLDDYQEFKGGSVAFGGSNGRITGKGNIETGRLDFEDVYCVEELKHYNLFSVSQMYDKKNKVLFTDTDCLVLSPDFKWPDENQVLLKIPRQHNMYCFNLKNIDPSGDLGYLFAKASIDESNNWHRRLGHMNFKNLNKLVKGNLVRAIPSKIFENDHTCVAWQKGKQHKASCKAKTVSSVNKPLQILHMDLFEPTSIKSINHKTYCLVITDGFSRLKGIKREYSNARTSQQNGVAERKNRTPIEAARTMAFRVYNLETKRVEEKIHVNFLENKPNVEGEGHAWMFDLDYLTNSMIYEPVLVENQANKSASPKEANNSAGTQANDNQGANLEEIDLNEEHFVLPIWSAYSTNVKSLGDKIEKNTSFKICEKPVSQVEQVFLED